MAVAKKLAVVLGLLSFVLVAGPVPRAEAAPDPYNPKAPTDCVIRVPAEIKKGNRIVVRVRIEANSQTKPTGTVTVRLFGPSSGIAIARAGEIWSTTRHYGGTPLTIRGPALVATGNYRVTAHFEPDSPALFKECRAEARVKVVIKPFEDKRDDDDGNDGLLPDTGGPYFWLLLLGLGLVGGGGATVVYARRRQAAPVAVT